MNCFDKSYDLRQASLIAPAAGGLEAHRADKQRHGAEVFACQGDVTLGDGALCLCGLGGGAWAAPLLWSGVKNTRVRLRFRIEQVGDDPKFGVKFGRVWRPEANGPRLVLKPDTQRVFFSGDEGEGPIGEQVAALSVGRSLELETEYAFDEQRLRARLDGIQILDMPLPHEPLDAFTPRYGRPAPLTGTGVFAAGLSVTVESLAIRAGAPRRRLVAIGDSQTQRHFWVQALERALCEPVTNLGIGGDCAALCCLRFARDVLPLRPEVVVIFAGTNDLGWGRTPAEITADIEAMVLAAQAAGVRPLVGEILPRRSWQGIPETNRALHEMCGRHRVGVLAWYAATKDPATDEQRPGFAPDGCHPGAVGAAAMIKALDLELFASIGGETLKAR